MNNIVKKYSILLLLCLCFFNLLAQKKQNDLRIPYKKDNKWGYSDKEGNIIVLPVYDQVETYFGKEPYFIVLKDKLSGIVDHSGNIVIPTKYQLCTRSLGNYFVVANQYKKFGILNKENEVVFPLEYERIFIIEDMFNKNSYLEIHKNGKVGILHLVENKLKFLIPMKYEAIRYEVRDATFICWKNNKEREYISAGGEKYTPNADESSYPRRVFPPSPPGIPDGKLRVTSKTFKNEKGKLGMIITKKAYEKKTRSFQLQSTHTIPAKFDSIYRIYRDFIIIINNGKQGVVSESGQILLATKFHTRTRFPTSSQWLSVCNANDKSTSHSDSFLKNLSIY